MRYNNQFFILLNTLSLSLLGQMPNKYSYGGYKFEEIKTNIPTSAYVHGFINNAAVVAFKNEKFILVDTLGNTLTTNGYEYINVKTNDNYFFVRKNDKFGVINSKGEVVIPFIYNDYYTDWGTEYISVFQNGLCMVKSQNNKYGFVNKKGEIVIKPIYKEIMNPKWSEGTIVLELNGFAGIVDTLGKTIVPFEYWQLTPFSCGHSLAMDSLGNVLILDRNCKKKKLPYKGFKSVYSEFGGFRDGIAGVKNSENLWGYVDTSGNEISVCQFDEISDFSERRARVSKQTNRYDYSSFWGYINTEGKLITPIKYQEVNDFHDGIAMVRMENTEKKYLYYNYVNIHGKVINNFEYGNAFKMSSGVSRVQKSTFHKIQPSNEYGISGPDIILTRNGQEINVDKKYSLGGLYFSDGLIEVYSDSAVGFADTKGELTVPCIYKFAYEFNNNYAWVQKKDDAFWYILKRRKIK